VGPRAVLDAGVLDVNNMSRRINMASPSRVQFTNLWEDLIPWT
jgi:hypothetical protein